MVKFCKSPLKSADETQHDDGHVQLPSTQPVSGIPAIISACKSKRKIQERKMSVKVSVPRWSIHGIYSTTPGTVESLLRLQCDAEPTMFHLIFGGDMLNARHLYLKFQDHCDGNLLKFWAGLDLYNHRCMLGYLVNEERKP
jgi:hypothetical protein